MRLLNVLDGYNQLCLTIQVDRHCRVAEIIDTIEDLLKLYDRPVICKWTMTWKFVAKALQKLCDESGCNTAYMPPGSPWENSFMN